MFWGSKSKYVLNRTLDAFTIWAMVSKKSKQRSVLCQNVIPALIGLCILFGRIFCDFFPGHFWGLWQELQDTKTRSPQATQPEIGRPYGYISINLPNPNKNDEKLQMIWFLPLFSASHHTTINCSRLINYMIISPNRFIPSIAQHGGKPFKTEQHVRIPAIGQLVQTFNNRGHDITNPNNALLQGKSLKITFNLQCSIPSK